MKLYINTETLEYPFDESGIKLKFPNISFGETFEAPEPFKEVIESPKPVADELHEVTELAPIFDSVTGTYSKVWDIKQKFATTEEERAYLAELKKAQVPSSITMRQARLAMIDAGIYADVDTALAAMTGVEGDKARVEWEYAATIERNSALLTSLGTALAMSEETIDDLFILASKL